MYIYIYINTQFVRAAQPLTVDRSAASARNFCSEGYLASADSDSAAAWALVLELPTTVTLAPKVARASAIPRPMPHVASGGSP